MAKKVKKEEVEDVVHRQCEELDAWREKYRKLSSEALTLRQSNALMEAELKRMREAYDNLQRGYQSLKNDNEYLLNRSFLLRLFNKRR